MFTKLALSALLATAIGVQALPQGSGEHTCNQECLVAASAHGLPPQGCAADDLSCLGCGAPGFVQAMTQCLAQSCHENVTLTCATAAVRRQEASSTASIEAPGASASASESAVAPGASESASAPADASGSGTLAPSAVSGSAAPSAASGSAAASASASASGASASGSLGTTVVSVTGGAGGATGSPAGASGGKQTNTVTATNSAPGSQNTDGGNNGGSGTNSAVGGSAPVLGFAAVAAVVGSGLLL